MFELIFLCSVICIAFGFALVKSNLPYTKKEQELDDEEQYRQLVKWHEEKNKSN